MKLCFLTFSLLHALGLSPMDGAREPVTVDCRNVQEAHEYLDNILEKCPSTVTINLPHEISISVVRELCETFTGSGYANQYNYTMEDGVVSLTPEYNDWAYMRGVALGVLKKSVLEGDSRKAYEQAREMAEKVKDEVEKVALPPGISREYLLALRLHDEVCRHAVYKPGSKVKPVEAVTKILQEGQGVCEGYTRLYSLLLTMCGLENRYISGYARGEIHVWNMVKLDGEWVHVDVTWDDTGKGRKGELHHQYFGMSDSMMAKDHKWDRTRCPAATTDKLLYANRVKD